MSKEEVVAAAAAAAISLYHLPVDIYDSISEFLDNQSLFVLLTLSPRHITVSKYLLQQRKWREKVIDHWAKVGDLKAVQYLYGCRGWHMKPTMRSETKTTPPKISRNGDLYGGKIVFCFIYEGNCPSKAMYAACETGHLPVVAFLHNVGVFFDKTFAMKLARENGHLDVMGFLDKSQTEKH